MKTTCLRTFSLLIIVCMILTFLPVFSFSEEEKMEKVEVWCRTDIILESEKHYDNAYTDVDIDAVFTHTDGTAIHLYGFWNGGNEWRVRFAPTKEGVWEYVVTCSDTDNTSLHNVKGKIIAVKNTGNTDIDRHGFVKISENGRYFVYDDGTPFFWLGDTNWQSPNYVSINSCNYPGCKCDNQFVHEVNDRLAKGFTVFQTYFDSGETDGQAKQATSMWSKKYNKINPTVFSKKYDYMFDYLASRGMVIALGFGLTDYTVDVMGKEALDRLSRYMTARYSAYPIVWMTAQEITGSDNKFNTWVSSSRIVDAGDGYDHPHSAHQSVHDVDNEYVKALDKEDWHDFYMVQGGHGHIPTKETYKGYYNNTRGGVKPLLESESNYEDIYCYVFTAYSAARISAWKATLCGSCGYTYGVTGIFVNSWSTSGNIGSIGNGNTEPWYMGLDKPGSYEMKYLADFYKTVDFTSLVPRYDNGSYSDFYTEDKVLASSADSKTFVAYFYNEDLSTGIIKGLNPGEKYSAYWYDSLTGIFTLINDNIVVRTGNYTVPEKPNCSDWVFLLTQKELTGDFRTGPLPEIEERTDKRSENVLTGADASESTFNPYVAGGYATHAIDGRDDTWWCASDSTFPQWVTFDMKEEREFDYLTFTTLTGTRKVSYKIECSDDGETMRTVYETDSSLPDYAGSTVFTAKLDKTEKCRYIKVTITNVDGSWATMVEADAYAYTRSAPEELPTYSGVVQTPGIFCSGSNIYKSATNDSLKDTSYALIDNDISTEWKPFAYETTQTVLLDLYQKKQLFGINVILGESVSPFDFRVMGSNDGQDWTLIADSKTSGLKEYVYGDRASMSSTLSGEYRYIKLIFMGSPGKVVKKTVSEIQLYAEGSSSEKPESVDISGLLSLYNEYRKINNINKKYSGSSYRNLLISIGQAADVIIKADSADEVSLSSATANLKKAYGELTAPENANESQSNCVTEPLVNVKNPYVLPVIIGAMCLAAAAAVTAVIVYCIKKGK